MVRSFPLGDEIQVSATFTNRSTGVPQNPNTVTLRLRDPNGAITNIPAIANPAVGRYISAFTPNIPGTWYLRWEGTGAVQSAIENRFEVNPSVFPNPQ